MTEKILFVDIDGPLIPGRSYFLDQQPIKNKLADYQFEDQKRFEFYVDKFGLQMTMDPIAVAMVNDILKQTNASIVVHSTWSYLFNEKDVKKVLEVNGIHGPYHEDWTTPKDPNTRREHQVKLWLDKHPEVDMYAILDDSDIFENYQYAMGHFVKVDFHEGFTMQHYIKTMLMLGGRQAVVELLSWHDNYMMGEKNEVVDIVSGRRALSSNRS